ncbi:hypothetical protein HWV62_1328 [Athelia sp. TMB]|nr:hypothetical protein HWV62_1328 [Athelia sp. TMB]
MARPASLPVVPLAPPHILLPSARLTVAVPRALGEQLLALFERQPPDQPPVVAAVPLVPAPADSPAPEKGEGGLAEWGVAARAVRIVRPPPRSPRHPFFVTLQGLHRIRLPPPSSPAVAAHTDALNTHAIEYPDSTQDTPPAREAVEAFRGAALRLLARLAQDAPAPAQREAWGKVAGMVEDVEPARAGWLADVLVAAVNSEYADKMAFLAAATPAARVALATALFSKQASITEVARKIAASVDESLSKQQKEFFLRQQMAAIQRELAALNAPSPRSLSSNPNSPSNPNPNSSNPNNNNNSNGRSELDDDDAADESELASLKAKLEALPPGEARRTGVREWRRLRRTQAGSVEGGVLRTYLETLVAVPWPSPSSSPAASEVLESGFLERARAQLDADHFGLEKVKRRLIEYLAVVRLKALNAERAAADALSADAVPFTGEAAAPAAKAAPTRGPILLFTGPPGTGKTSVAQSLARALGRPFARISLGGVRDEAEIRGHRRTYVAAGPGAIVQALRKAGRSDCVLLLDEIDKVGNGGGVSGDPGAALLEVLDPEQNGAFVDHYVSVPIDLSRVLFVCTANTLDAIAPPLLDRCEIIPLSDRTLTREWTGYTYDEKTHIARRFLLPKQLAANGLAPGQADIAPAALAAIATQYTREAGVRSLERAIGAVVRHKAVQWAERADGAEEAQGEWVRTVEEGELEGILGVARWDGEEREREERRGVTYGLVVSGVGEGGILPVESTLLPGTGQLRLTGSLGDVIKESAELALTWVKTHAYDLRLTHARGEDVLRAPAPVDIHIHLPAGATKKDGPSAGVALVCALVSLLSGACVPPHVAMTGEITLRGRVAPVGGVKEKVLGAHRAGVRTVILPWANRKDVEADVAPAIRAAMDFVFVRTVGEALEAAFGTGVLEWRGGRAVLMESRL